MATSEPIGPKLIEKLLYQSEGTALDFKRDQYPFEGVGDHEKAELLKDILAFANSFRTNAAHILIGVHEVEGARAEVVGVTTHLKDADLQQFVNSKTNQTLELSYTAVDIDGKSVGVIQIPKQTRPFYLRKDFGWNPNDGPKGRHLLSAGMIYFRTGSSTKVASHDDAYRMGKVDAADDRPMPVLDLTFADVTRRVSLTREIVTSHIVDICSEEIPDYVEETTRDVRAYALPMHTVNREFFREAAEYVKFLDGFRPIGFAIRNTASTLASDVVVEVTFPSDSDVVLLEDGDIPVQPRPTWNQLDHIVPMATWADRIRQPLRPDVYIERRGDDPVVVIRFGKLQAHELKVCERPVHFMCRAARRDVKLEVVMRTDEIGIPQSESLTISASASKRRLEVSDFAQIVYDRLYPPNAGVTETEEAVDH